MKFSAVKESFIFLAVALMFALAVWQWPTAPEQMPVHWNWQGQPDAFGGKARGLLLLPFAALGVQLLLMLVPRFDPRYKNYSLFPGAYATIRFGTLGFFFALYAFHLAALNNSSIDFARVSAALVGALLIVLSTVLSRLKSNWFFGVRTPWTLSSKQSWDKTNKLASKIFLALGLATIAGAGVGTGLGYAILIAGLIVTVIVCLVYSYTVWKADPKKDKMR